MLIGVGLGCWLWLLQHRNLLPSPEVKAGKALLKQYQATSHDIFLALLALSAIALLVLSAAPSISNANWTKAVKKNPQQGLRF